MTLYKAITDFKETKFPTFSRSIRSRYRMAIAHFLVNKEYGDMVLEFDALKRRIVALRSQCALDPITRQKIQYKLQAFLDYYVNCGWID